jgi:hypothetical protein
MITSSGRCDGVDVAKTTQQSLQATMREALSALRKWSHGAKLEELRQGKEVTKKSLKTLSKNLEYQMNGQSGERVHLYKHRCKRGSQ